MNKFKTFFYILKNSFEPKYYKEVVKTSFNFSLKYYFFFFAFFTFFAGTYISLKYIFPLSDSFKKLPQKIVDLYPQNLKLSYQNNQLSTNYTKPIIISVKNFDSLISNYNNNTQNFFNNFKNVLVIDTQASEKNFKDYHTLILLTQNEIITAKGESAYHSTSYELNTEMDDWVLDKNSFLNLINKIKPFFSYLIYIFIFMIFFSIAIAIPFGEMLILIIYSLFFMLLSKISDQKINFKKSLQISLHLETIWILLFSLITLINWEFKIPFAQTIFMGIYYVVILDSLKTKTIVKKNK